MLHELLLALSGHASPLLDDKKDDALVNLLSPSERTLLRSLACLGSLQAQIRDRCTRISSSHKSTICRAVCASITRAHLARFNDKIVDVESSILRNDAEFVGAYDIVPLSAIVAAFDGWDRVLKWLDRLVVRMMPAGSEAVSDQIPFVSGAQLMDFLRGESHTGYPKIERIASDLLRISETTWIRQLIPWLLYGRLPPHGTEDFFIQQIETSSTTITNDSYSVDQSLTPDVLDSETAYSVLFVGRSLQHIQRGQAKLSPASTADLESARATVLSEQFSLLETLELPLSSFSLRQAVDTMRSTLSRNALQKLLPFSNIVRVLDVLRQFLLLERGEFAVALIGAADDCLAGRHLKRASHKDRTRLGGMMIKDGEVNSVLARTWASLTALQDINDDDEDEDLEYARDIVELSIRRQPEDNRATPATAPASRHENQALFFDDVLLATPTTLTIRLSPPLDIFLSERDVQEYSLIHAYLLGIRRAHLHLADLWKLSTLRRSYPTPRVRQEDTVASRNAVRHTTHIRLRRMRGVWAAISRARFFFAQINDYLQGEVVRGCTESLQRWIDSEAWAGSTRSRPATRHGTQNPETASDFNLNKNQHLAGGVRTTGSHTTTASYRPTSSVLNVPQARHDPEALAAAHRSYLAQLKDSLLLNEAQFVMSVRNLMTRVDHAGALTQRLAVVTQITQLGEQTAIDADTVHSKEENDLIKSLDSVRKSINSNLEELLRGLQDLDDRKRMGVLPSQRIAGGTNPDVLDGRSGASRREFLPWQGPGLSRLLLRLESASHDD